MDGTPPPGECPKWALAPTNGVDQALSPDAICPSRRAVTKALRGASKPIVALVAVELSREG